MALHKISDFIMTLTLNIEIMDGLFWGMFYFHSRFAYNTRPGLISTLLLICRSNITLYCNSVNVAPCMVTNDTRS